MKFIVCENYDEVSSVAADFFREQIEKKPSSVLGLATGSSPIGMYEKMCNMGLDFSRVTIYNLDEYYPIAPTNNQSYYYFMNENLYSKCNLKPENINIPNGAAEDAEAECRRYEEKMARSGGIDLQVLGIGQNGHIGFNEPDSELFAYTHMTGLTESTINANARFFEKREDVPTRALTMGMASIMLAKKIILIACGESKREVVARLLDDKITTEVPASMLKMHPDVTIICDKAAYGK